MELVRDEKLPEFERLTKQQIRARFSLRTYPVIHVLQFFADDNLPQMLFEALLPFRLLAFSMTENSADGPELTVALRNLLDSREAYTRHYSLNFPDSM